MYCCTLTGETATQVFDVFEREKEGRGVAGDHLWGANWATSLTASIKFLAMPEAISKTAFTTDK